MSDALAVVEPRTRVEEALPRSPVGPAPFVVPAGVEPIWFYQARLYTGPGLRSERIRLTGFVRGASWVVAQANAVAILGGLCPGGVDELELTVVRLPPLDFGPIDQEGRR